LLASVPQLFDQGHFFCFVVFVSARSPIQQSTVCFFGCFCFCGDYLPVGKEVFGELRTLKKIF
jgi:hypothetical protein